MDKIAVVNRTNLKNYGSVLQVYALTEAVKNLGYEAEVVWESGNLSKNFDFRPQKIMKTGWKILTHPYLLMSTMKTILEIRVRPKLDAAIVEKFDEFVRTYIDQTLFAPDELKRIAYSDSYRKFICGSDQIWCSTTTYVDPLMYLRFAPKEKRIAYAPSIGRTYIPSYNRQEMKKYIADILQVSVREEDGKRLIKELTGQDAPVVVDPTLLFDREYWHELGNLEAIPEQKYILCYFLDLPNSELQEKMVAFAKEQNCRMVVIGTQLPEIPEALLQKTIAVGPSEFLSLVENATYVITDSYHGMLFSINFEREFYSIERDYKQFDQSSRQKTVLGAIGLMDRYQKSDCGFRQKEIDYENVRQQIAARREMSLAFLRGALEKGV